MGLIDEGFLKSRLIFPIYPTGLGMISFASAVEQGAEATALLGGERIDSKKNRPGQNFLHF